MKLTFFFWASVLSAVVGHALPRSAHYEDSAVTVEGEYAHLQKRSGRRTKTKLGGCGGYMAFTCATLSNATPYRLHRGYIHEYQIHNWKAWPAVLEPGQSFTFSPAYRGRGLFPFKRDTAAEVVYHLEGTEEPASFRLEFRPGDKHHTWVRFLEAMETKSLPRNAEIDLGWREDPDDGPRFVLAGREGDFITNDGPVAWMQSMLDDIGDLPLSDVVLGRSHHAGSYVNKPTGTFARRGNTQTQTEDLYTQLRDGGVRVLDVRVMAKHNKTDTDKYDFFEVHGTKIGGKFAGAVGASVADMVHGINRFNDDYPGELIIIDIHDKGWEYNGRLSARGRRALFDSLKQTLKHRFRLPDVTDGYGDGNDYTKLALRRFIGNGTSGVIVRVSDGWANDDSDNDDDDKEEDEEEEKGNEERKENIDFPGYREGFVTTHTFPIVSRWSNTKDREHLMRDQFESLRRHRERHDTRRLHDMQWLLTIQGADNIHKRISIVPIARRKLWTRAFSHMFAKLSTNLYPNWLTIDSIQGTEFKALVMAMNKCFAARACGDWADESRIKR